ARGGAVRAADPPLSSMERGRVRPRAPLRLPQAGAPLEQGYDGPEEPDPGDRAVDCDPAGLPADLPATEARAAGAGAYAGRGATDPGRTAAGDGRRRTRRARHRRAGRAAGPGAGAAADHRRPAC